MIMVDYRNVFYIVYFGDLMIYSENYQEHIRHLALVVQRVRLHGPTCAVDRCRFGKTSLEYVDSSTLHERTESRRST